jgi:hypothetical protein
MASESDEGRYDRDREDGGARKKRRVAPTLIQVGGYSITDATATGPEKRDNGAKE